MKIALTSDNHFGVRNDNPAFHRYFTRFYSEVFFPYLRENSVTTIINLGDLVDRRKYINFLSARALRKSFIEPALAEFDLHIILGNHDVFFKNTNSLNSIEELYWMNTSDKLHWYEKAEEVEFDGCKILFLPWMNSENREETMSMISLTDATVALGHLEISGFAMYKGSVSHGGQDPSDFSKFDLVCSGHFHTRSSYGNIHYLGAPCEYTWSDFNDPRGFHIFDTETRQLTFVRNPISMFKKIFYDDTEMSLEEIMDFDTSGYLDTIVKVIVKSKTNPYWFDCFIEKLESSGVIDLQVVEDHMNLNLEDDQDIIDEAEGTLEIFQKAIDQMNVPFKDKLYSTIEELHEEAMTIE
jgi:DNA repair exonuclease SbcCD nuclease subunit